MLGAQVAVFKALSKHVLLDLFCSHSIFKCPSQQPHFHQLTLLIQTEADTEERGGFILPIPFRVLITLT